MACGSMQAAKEKGKIRSEGKDLSLIHIYDQKEFVNTLCSSFGKVMPLSESYLPLFCSIAGCAPAYAYMFIDSLARSAVKNGMNKAVALEIAAQTVLGSAKKILESCLLYTSRCV